MSKIRGQDWTWTRRRRLMMTNQQRHEDKGGLKYSGVGNHGDPQVNKEQLRTIEGARKGRRQGQTSHCDTSIHLDFIVLS